MNKSFAHIESGELEQLAAAIRFVPTRAASTAECQAVIKFALDFKSELPSVFSDPVATVTMFKNPTGLRVLLLAVARSSAARRAAASLARDPVRQTSDLLTGAEELIAAVIRHAASFGGSSGDFATAAEPLNAVIGDMRAKLESGKLAAFRQTLRSFPRLLRALSREPVPLDALREWLKPISFDLVIAVFEHSIFKLVDQVAADMAHERGREILSDIARNVRRLISEALPILECDRGVRLAAVHPVFVRVVERWKHELQAQSRPALSRIVDSSLLLHVQIASQAMHALPVLVLGETGTGKEAAARAIHDMSARGAKPFVAVNLGGLPQGLIESELFGHARGAGSGITRSREGLFREANGGTIFLDELGEAPPEVQTRLLRLLSEGLVRRVGENRETPVDVRVIAATNRDLVADTREGRFRNDLYYRLRPAFALKLVPLRERPAADVAQLWAHLVERARKDLGGQSTFFPTASREDGETILAASLWPGNVRELESVVQEYVLLSRGLPVASPARLMLPQMLPSNTVSEVPTTRETIGAQAPADSISQPFVNPAVVRQLFVALDKKQNVDEHFDNLLEEAVQAIRAEKPKTTWREIGNRVGLAGDAIRHRVARAKKRRAE